MHLSQMAKMVFVVDRKDLNYQTSKEFNSFSKGSVDGTSGTCLIVTIIQKLNSAIIKVKSQALMEQLSAKRWYSSSMNATAVSLMIRSNAFMNFFRKPRYLVLRVKITIRKIR
ncbi:hypothetical protein BWI96_10625 [Siphonobacter sp. SORGH_AS_0500]|uniref:hypothetical protein n=1 Tax=Siphonobacter sp. SORGH_AS_0500 TaxID=1864824 RepID=UPI000CC595FC|nr:hypothetical protein BWI96_10625 [Siphonobacter sp. SORGH_AS_0500]